MSEDNTTHEDGAESGQVISLMEHRSNKEKDNGWANPGQVKEESQARPRKYEIHTKIGRPFETYGVLMVTPVFIAIGDADGNFKVVVPMESLDYVTNTEDFVEQSSSAG